MPVTMQQLEEERQAAVKLANLFKSLWQSAEKDCDRLIFALHKIAAYDDVGASARLERIGSYSAFDEPYSVQIARETLQALRKENYDAVHDCGCEVQAPSTGTTGHPSERE